MAAAATIVLADATPTNHNFEVADVGSGRATFEDRSGGVYNGYPRVTIALRRPKPSRPGQPASRMVRALVKVDVPVMETLGTGDNGLTPAPTVAFTTIASLEFVFPERGTLTSRKDTLAYMKNLLAKSEVTALVEKFELPY